MNFKFHKELYPREALLKAAYNYTDRAFVHLDADESFYYVDLEMRSLNDVIEEKEFVNEMLAQTVRHVVYQQTKNIRQLMLARAMASTIVADTDDGEDADLEGDNYLEDEILKDWFLGNEDFKD